MRLEDRRVLTMLGQELFPADNAWNQVIANAPVAANSTAIMQNIISKFGDAELRPDFMQDFQTHRAMYGMPYNVVRGNSTPKVKVVIDNYRAESDLFDVPIPPNAVLQGDWQDGPMEGVANRGDSHLIVWDADNNVSYELYRVSRPSENADGKWHAYSETVWDMKGNTFRPLGWTSGDAAGLSLLAGLVRPEEALPVSQGGQGVIDHAIRFTLANSLVLNQYQYPASHAANPGNTNAAIMPPMGTRFRLKASVDISGLNPQSKIIAQAMKTYGMILADNGGTFHFSGSNASVDVDNRRTLTWNNADIHDPIKGMKSLDYSDFEIVDLKPVVTGLSASSGVAGTRVTITGKNFSGSAGRLQVLFGTQPATSVTYVDDSRLTAIVPAGSGSVDVRVQSGIAASAADNFNSPIFGYGISNVTAAGRFTYSGSTLPGAQATFLGADSTTKGNWKAAYGVDGANVIGDATSYPTYATVTASGHTPYVWTRFATDPRALLRLAAGSTNRIAAAWYGSQFTVNVAFNDSLAHKLTIYAADMDSTTRIQRVDLIDPSTGVVLDTRTMSSFQGGQYLSWNVKGRVQLRFTRLAGVNALLAGLFFGGPPINPVSLAGTDATMRTADVAAAPTTLIGPTAQPSQPSLRPSAPYVPSGVGAWTKRRPALLRMPLPTNESSNPSSSSSSAALPSGIRRAASAWWKSKIAGRGNS